jgi:hypothetical protein
MSNLLPCCQLQKEEGPLDSETVRCLLTIYCTYIHIYLYTNIPWIHKCVTEVGYGASHEYTIYTILTV